MQQHICRSRLGGPFLPQAFVVSLKRGSYTGDVNEYLHRSLDTALRIAENNPGLMTIQHYDPVHDGWMTRFINHLRFKLLDLPPAYAEFIRSNLEPGGAVVYLDSGASWLRYRLGPRSVFQVGGWGGISPEEFLEGSERIRDLCTPSRVEIHGLETKGLSTGARARIRMGLRARAGRGVGGILPDRGVPLCPHSPAPPE